jgi:Ser/Thr protein kinase RdoA (MazF antagonist)
VKLPSASWKARAITALPRLPQTEVRFYNEIAARLEIRRPTALAAASRLGRGYTLVIGDVTEVGSVPGRSGEALQLAQAESMVDLLAALHAPLWEHPDLAGELAWLAGPVRKLEDRLGTALAVPLMKRGLARAADTVPEAVRGPALVYARQRRRAMRHLAEGPRTLVHHDCHPGNLFWHEGAAGLLDWQLVRAGEGVSDVAYLLATALEPETRRAHERDLVWRYGEGLRRQGVDAPSGAELLGRYQAHLTYAFEAMVVTLAVGGLMDEAVAHEMVRRTAAAVSDHDAFARVIQS